MNERRHSQPYITRAQNREALQRRKSIHGNIVLERKELVGPPIINVKKYLQEIRYDYPLILNILGGYTGKEK